MTPKTHKFASLFIIVAFSVFGCSYEDVEVKESHYKIFNASATEKAAVSGWVSPLPPRKISTDFDLDELQKIVDVKNGYEILTILNSMNRNEAVSFALDDWGQVSFVFFSRTLKKENGDITNDIYSPEGAVKLSYVDKIDGTRSITYIERSGINGKTDGWWSDADNCVGKFHNLTGSNIGDIAVTAIFNAATMGLYTPLSLVLCAGYATAKGGSGSKIIKK